MKTTKSISHGIYGFQIRQYYHNMFVILFTIDDQRIWILNGNDITINKINIGKNQSIYSQYEIGSIDLVSDLTHKYNNFKEFLKTLKEINTPRSLQAVQEHEFNRYREQLFPNLTFDYPEIDGSIYDCVINKTFKVQDKVISSYYQYKTNNREENREKKSYTVKFSRSRKYKNITYKLGDNDYYWFHLPDKAGAYIIPQQILYDKKYISISDQEVKSLLSLYPYHSEQELQNIKNAWMNEYLYLYDKNDTKHKIELLFDNKNKPNLISNYISPIVIVDKERPDFINYKKIVHNLVITIFKNVIAHNKIIKKCSECDNHISKDNISGVCIFCLGKIKFLSARNRKVERPPYEQLLNEVKTLNYCGTGRKYNVSDNAIRKWIKTYEKFREI